MVTSVSADPTPATAPESGPRKQACDGADAGPCLGPVSGLDLSPVLAALLAHHPDVRPDELERVMTAFDIADVAHAPQRRATGEPYMVHPLAVAAEVADLGMDADTVAAALCHDVVEDTPVTVEALADAIGPVAARLVDGVTKLDEVADASKSARVAGSLRKLLVAATTDVRVLVIKLADRLHNMRTVGALPPQKQVRVATETLEVYAPLAHRLGMSETKAALEDAAFLVLEPDKAHEIAALIAQAAPSSMARLDRAIAEANAALATAGLNAHVTGRQKTVYSAYRKMQVRQVPFADIADLIGLRVIVDTPAECYAALGVLHAVFTPVPARFRDYIALPKWGQYRSLHTTVIDRDGVTFEAQVRTWQMHAQAEFGVAAHWKYKANAVGAPGPGHPPMVGDLPWLADLLAAGAAEADPDEFLNALRRDLGAGEIVTLTPRGDVVPLPAGATALDFAYRVHTEVGHSAVAVRVNGRLRTVGVTLVAGDRVEVITDTGQGGLPGPRTEWLDLVTTARAAHAIRARLALRHREDALEHGWAEIARAVERDVPEGSELNEALAVVAGTFGYVDADALAMAVGEGHVPTSRVAARLRNQESSEPGEQPGEQLGDEHVVAPDAPVKEGPLLAVRVEALDRRGLLAGVCDVVTGAGGDVLEVHAAAGQDRVARVGLVVAAADSSHAARIRVALAQVEGVFSVCDAHP